MRDLKTLSMFSNGGESTDSDSSSDDDDVESANLFMSRGWRPLPLGASPTERSLHQLQTSLDTDTPLMEVPARSQTTVPRKYQLKLPRVDAEADDDVEVGTPSKDHDSESRTVPAGSLYKCLMGLLLIICVEMLFPFVHGHQPSTVTSYSVAIKSSKELQQNVPHSNNRRGLISSIHALGQELWYEAPTGVDCVVVGGGITGVTAAFYLHQKLLSKQTNTKKGSEYFGREHYRVRERGGVVLCEARGYLGGNFHSRKGTYGCPMCTFCGNGVRS
jgi:hypothetical protein